MVATKKKALEQGKVSYYPGTRCKNGSVSLRRTEDGACMCFSCKKERNFI